MTIRVDALKKEIRDCIADAIEEVVTETLEPILQQELNDIRAWLTIREDAFSVMVGWGDGDAAVEVPLKIDIDDLLDNNDDTSIVEAVDNLLPRLATLREKALESVAVRISEKTDWCTPVHLDELRKRAPVIQPPLGFLE